MRILIAGGSGFIGQHLARHLAEDNHTVTVLGRSLPQLQDLFFEEHSFHLMDWTVLMRKDNPLVDYDIVINLCGVNIGDKRWSDQRKKELIQSRVEPTRILAELCARASHSLRLFNASAIGIYGLQETERFTEESEINCQNPSDFLSQIGCEWEQATASAQAAGVKVVLMRFGVVLSDDGGALQKMKRPFLLGLGGRIGHGNQPFSWVSLPDLLNAISFLIANPDITGPINIVSPGVVTQREFAKAFAHALHRPSFMITPAFLIKLIFNEMGEELLLKGQNVYPKRLLELGFQFQYPTISQALLIS